MMSLGLLTAEQAMALGSLSEARGDADSPDLVVVLDVPPEACLKRGGGERRLPGFGRTMEELEALDTALFQQVVMPLDSEPRRPSPDHHDQHC